MGICSDSAVTKTVKSQWPPCAARGHSGRGGRRLPSWIWDPWAGSCLHLQAKRTEVLMQKLYSVSHTGGVSYSFFRTKVSAKH